MKRLQHIIGLLLLIIFNILSIVSFSQIAADSLVKNTAAINIFNYQNLEFGAFAQGAGGGTITVSPDGTRSVTGNIILLNLGAAYFPAIFEVEVPQNSMISVLNGQDAILRGSNGGSITLKIGKSDPLSPFVTSVEGRTKVSIGGTLTVGNTSSSPPGNYSGEFYISFIVE